MSEPSSRAASPVTRYSRVSRSSTEAMAAARSTRLRSRAEVTRARDRSRLRSAAIASARARAVTSAVVSLAMISTRVGRPLGWGSREKVMEKDRGWPGSHQSRERVLDRHRLAGLGHLEQQVEEAGRPGLGEHRGHRHADHRRLRAQEPLGHVVGQLQDQLGGPGHRDGQRAQVDEGGDQVALLAQLPQDRLLAADVAEADPGAVLAALQSERPAGAAGPPLGAVRADEPVLDGRRSARRPGPGPPASARPGPARRRCRGPRTGPRSPAGSRAPARGRRSPRCGRPRRWRRGGAPRRPPRPRPSASWPRTWPRSAADAPAMPARPGGAGRGSGRVRSTHGGRSLPDRRGYHAMPGLASARSAPRPGCPTRSRSRRSCGPGGSRAARGARTRCGR